MLETTLICSDEVGARIEDEEEFSVSLDASYQVTDMRPASKDKIGGILVGDGLEIDENGRLSVKSQQQTEGSFLDNDDFLNLFD